MLLQAAQRDWDDSNRRLAELDAELAAEKARHAETRKRLEAAEARGPEHQPKGYAGELYSAVLLNETELVAGKKGIYHAIRLFSPARETIPKFDLGSYRLDTTRHQEVAKAFAELNREVVSALATGGTVTIFVRGRANSIGFKGPGALHAGLCSGNSVSYLPYDRSANKYASAATKQVLARTYTNQELPNLRAAFIACIAQANIQPAELFILQGEIAETTDRRALTAEMFLFAGAPAKAANPCAPDIKKCRARLARVSSVLWLKCFCCRGHLACGAVAKAPHYPSNGPLHRKPPLGERPLRRAS